MVNPLPVELIKTFAEKVEKVYVIEELDDVIESHCKKIGVDVVGKELFPLCGEFNPVSYTHLWSCSTAICWRITGRWRLCSRAFTTG